MLSSRATSRTAALILALAALAGSNAANAQVTYFNQPPSVEELRKALGLDLAAPAAQPAFRSRGVLAAAPAASGAASAPAAPGGAKQQSAALNIQFELNSSRMTAGSMAYLEQVVKVMQQDTQTKMQVQGHTDVRGDRKTNILLSWDRALSVYRLMVEKFGIDPDRLQPVGKGAAEPLPDKSPLDATNRRVQFSLIPT